MAEEWCNAAQTVHYFFLSKIVFLFFIVNISPS